MKKTFKFNADITVTGAETELEAINEMRVMLNDHDDMNGTRGNIRIGNIKSADERKIYVVLERGCFDYEIETQCEVYVNRNDAVKEWNRRVELAETDAYNYLEDDERVIEKNEDKLSFDAYKDGYASQWECRVWVEEKTL